MQQLRELDQTDLWQWVFTQTRFWTLIEGKTVSKRRLMSSQSPNQLIIT